MTEIALLVVQAAQGDESAWNMIVDRYGSLVWSVIRGCGLNQFDAADVSQTTWLKLAENLDHIREPSKLGGWLATTARREAIRISSQSSNSSIPFDPESAGNSPDLLASLLERETSDEILVAFASLSEKCQHILRATIADAELSYQEISDALDIPIGSIGPNRARCLAHLRQLLKTSNDAGLTSRENGKPDKKQTVN